MSEEPLANKIRPKNLDEMVGQSHLIGPSAPIRRLIETKNLHSLIFWGPPGCGKTTLAKIIAAETNTSFHLLSAVSAGKNDVRKIIEEAKKGHQQIKLNNKQSSQKKTSPSNTHLLFLDEIHRFNKAQQDYLLPYVENGLLTLIGATTENPSFTVISPLLSRCQVFILNQLTDKEISQVINRALNKLKKQKSTSGKDAKVALTSQAKNFLVSFANGDARQALNLLENTYKLYKQITIDNLKQTLQSKHIRYDKNAEEHYNTISAFIKSMRASNVDAALYYLARMVQAGEDPLFIARRMVIFASEDIGMALPTALVVANEVFKACETIGYPECAINLAHGVVYLASAKKDRGAYNALRAAQKDVQTYGNLPIPMQLRNAPTKLMKDKGYGEGYEMYTDKNLLPDKLKNKKYFKP